MVGYKNFSVSQTVRDKITLTVLATPAKTPSEVKGPHTHIVYLHKGFTQKVVPL